MRPNFNRFCLFTKGRQRAGATAPTFRRSEAAGDDDDDGTDADAEQAQSSTADADRLNE